MTTQSRRRFLAQVGWGMMVSSVGMGMTGELGLGAGVNLDDSSDALEFGELESLVRLMQDTPVDRLLPVLVGKLNNGTELRRLATAAALANARTFGGEDYVGFHTMMALAPAVHMSSELPEKLQPLPVFKVLYRNTNRIHEHGGRASEVLKKVHGTELPSDLAGGDGLSAGGPLTD